MIRTTNCPSSPPTYITHRLEIAFWQATIPLLQKRWTPRRWWLIWLGCLVLLAALWYTIPSARPHLPGLFWRPVDRHFQKVLVVVVDQLDKRNPALKGVWMLSISPQPPDWEFLPVFPGVLSGETTDAQLIVSFRLGLFNSLGQEFQQFLDAKGFKWDEFVVIDEVVLADIINQLGSIQIEDSTSRRIKILDSTQVIAQVFPYGNSLRHSSHRQAALIHSLCSHSVALFRDIEPSAVIGRFSRHISTSFPRKLLIQHWYEMRDYGRGIVCRSVDQKASANIKMP